MAAKKPRKRKMTRHEAGKTGALAKKMPLNLARKIAAPDRRAP